MNTTMKLILLLTTTAIFTSSCSKENSNPTATNLLSIEDALNQSDTGFVNLLNKVRGSVGTNGIGSKVIWSKKNDYNLGLFVSANHVYNISSWPSLNEEYIDLATINNGIYVGSKIPATNGQISLTNELAANFGLYHPQIPSNATNTTILPINDFYLGIIDNQKVQESNFSIYPNLLQSSIPLQMYDPDNRTMSNHTWFTAETNEIVLALGYPQDKVAYPNGAVSSGKIYSDLEAENIIQSLQQKGDVEGSISYNPEVEFLANVKAVAGMSGGGVFNANGQLLGIMVRGTALNGEPILRVVRMSYIVQKLNDFYDSLSLADKNKIRPFISGELN
jgi:hypothetical protein